MSELVADGTAPQDSSPAARVRAVADGIGPGMTFGLAGGRDDPGA
jgi:hypothetical protein